MLFFMKKDPHKKRQKQIRMSDDVRERFEAAHKASGLTAEGFIVKLLDLADGQNQPSKNELLAILRERIQ